MNKPINILLVEDNAIDALLIKEVFGTSGMNVRIETVESKPAFLEHLKKPGIDLIISDFSLPRYSGKEALHDAQQWRPDIPFIFYSGTIGEESAIEALKLGATDYILKDKPRRLTAAVERALNDAEQKRRQKQADQELRRHAELLDLTGDAIVVRDMADHIVFVNSGVERLYGYGREELLGKKSTEFMPLPMRNEFGRAKQATLNAGHWEGEMEQFTKSQQPLTVMSRWKLVRNPATQKDEILAVYTDITEKKSLEKQFLRAQRLESIGTLASGIAHDLNNILAPILMASEMLAEQPLAPHASQMVTTISSSAKRGADIVKQVLTFVRGSEGKRVPIMVNYLIKELTHVVNETFTKNIKVESNVERDLWLIMGDPTQLQQVLMNLSVNALDAMPDGGQLTLSARNKKEGDAFWVHLVVEDTGIGIPPHILDKIFDPFFTTKEMGKGTGLGLSTVMGIVKSHGGRITVHSQPGQGTRFDILLPADEKARSQQANDALARSPKGNGETILLVDDELEIRKTFSRILEQHGYDVIAVQDASSAIIEFSQRKNEIKVVIADQVMPGMDGDSLIRVMSSLKSELKFILISGLADRITSTHGTIVLNKPISATELLQALHQLLSAD